MIKTDLLLAKVRVRDVFTYWAVSRMENYDYHDVLTQ